MSRFLLNESGVGTAKDVESSLKLCEMAFSFGAEHLKTDAGPNSGTLV
jgi:hypothetical protein